jgi:MAF protein
MGNKIIVLASSSPRRQELISLLEQTWIVIVADVDEDSVNSSNPVTNVVETAMLKARHAAHSAPGEAIIIAADTMVLLDGRMLGKPSDEKEAKEMLVSLRGRTHQVHTGIVGIDNSNGRVLVDSCSVDVPMRDYGDDEIEAYIATGDPLDKAGAYAIQHPQFKPVDGLHGCYATVVGLPLCHLVRLLDQLGTVISVDVPAACQEHHNYRCPIFHLILDAGGGYGTM